MADTAKRLAGPTQLGSSATTIYTVPGSTTTTILHIIVANTTANATAFYLSIGADAAGKRIAHKYPIEGTTNGFGFVEIKGFIVMTAAEILQAYADTASACTLTVSGVETT